MGTNGVKKGLVGTLVVLFFAMMALIPSPANATSQWARKTGLSCNACHTVFPRLNSFGEEFLRNGYELVSPHQAGDSPDDEGSVYLDKLEHLLGFRLNMTPIMLETNSFQKDSSSERSSRITLGNPIWIQFFVAGSVYRNISFFSELEYAQSAFKFNWFYFNFTNLGNSRALNFQLGRISPLEFASYPNRLPQLPNIKGEVMLVKSSEGNGEESVDMSSARPGIQYFGRNDWLLVYAGASPGSKAVDVNQFLQYWGGVVLTLPENIVDGFEGSTATIHYYAGTDTKGSGSATQIENKFTRFSPQVNVRYVDKVDVQAAYVIAEDDNRALVASPAGSFKYDGFAFEGGYMLADRWHLAVHYDKYESDDKLPTGKPVIEFERVVPAITYTINQNIRLSVYYEKDLVDRPADTKVDKIYLNIRTMF